jgi:AraC family transcriptional regulator, transcriptional activator of pobA
MKTTFGADGRKPKLRHNLVVKLFSGTPLSQFGEVVTASPSDAQKKNAAKATVRTRPAVEIPLAEPAAMRIVPIARLAAGGRWRVEAMRALSEPVLLWFTRGQGRITVGGITRGYGAHNAVFIPAGMMHCFDVGSQTFGSALFFGADHGLDLPAEPLHLRIRDVVPQAELSGIIDNIQRETDSQRPASQKAALHYLGLMGVWLERQAEAHADEGPRPDASRRLARAYANVLEREFRSGKGVSELAQELGVTATHLTRVCNKTCGRSASDLLHDRLIFEARRILAETRTPVAEVARSLGFNSAAYFTRAFQHRVGKTPSAFRKSS